MSDQDVNIQLVGEVEKHQELYNYRLSEYARKDVTEKAWKEVAAKMNMPVAECKEKWRNLGTVFMRKMKPPPSGAGAKRKAYYLEDAMKFCLPFIKTSAPPSSGNLPPVPLNSTGNTEVVEEACEDSASQVDFSPISTQPSSSNYPAPSPFQHDITEPSQETSDRPEELSSSSQVKRKWKVRNTSAADADQCVAEYFKAKKARMQANQVESSSQKIDRQQGLKMFLLSLIPELEELSDAHIKLFKRRVFGIIDEISTSQHQSQTSTFHTLIPSPSDSSQISHTSQTSPSSQISPTMDFYNSFSLNLPNSDM